jgi:hypothetical protein
MQFFVLVLLICLFVFLYCVYVLSNDDFIFLRRDVTMDKIFNMIFVGTLFSLFFSRLIYGFSATSIFRNPFVFMLFPYFPGLSLLGGVVGIGVYFLYLTRRQGDPLPLGRIYDFFSIAFLISLPIGFVGYLLFLGKGIEVKLGIEAVLYFILFIIFLKFFLPKLLSGVFKEGTITSLFLICFSIISLISNAFSKISILAYLKNFENTLLILILISSVVFIFNKEGFVEKLRKKG